MSKNILTILALVILIVIVIVGVALLGIIPKSSDQQNSEGNATTSETAPFSNTTEEGYSLYTNNKYGFSIMYPTSLTKVDPETASGFTDDLDTSDIFVGKVPNDTFKGTNLYEVYIIAGAKKTDQNSCYYVIIGNDVRNFDNGPKPENVKINGIDFVKVTIGDAGAGNFYNTTRYSTFKDGTCYDLRVVAHSANLGIIHDTDPNIKQYTDDMFMPEFEEIVSFFKFI